MNDSTDNNVTPTPLRAILERPRPFIMAHRGDSHHAPENTLAAFRLALEAGADVIETDLWFTADDHLVCHHDATAERLTGDPRRIDAMNLSEVRALRVRSRFDRRFPDERIPMLEELLALTPPEVLLALELKHRRFAAPDRARQLVNVIKDRTTERSVVVISFEMDLLRAVKAVAPQVPIGHITMRNPLPIQATELIGPYWPLLFANPFYVRLAHRRGKWVAPFDPALHKRLSRYLAMGVDAVLTNDPAATRQAVERIRSRQATATGRRPHRAGNSTRSED